MNKNLLKYAYIKFKLNISKFIRITDNFKYGHYYVLNSSELKVYKYIGYGSVHYANGNNIIAENKKYYIFSYIGDIIDNNILNKCEINDINKLPMLSIYDNLDDVVPQLRNYVIANMITFFDDIPINIFEKEPAALFEINIPLKYTDTLKENKFIWKLGVFKFIFDLDD